MARKSTIQPFKALDAISMAGSVVQDGFTNVKTQDNLSYQIKWSGTAPVGEIVVEVTNDDLDEPRFIPTAVWVPLDFGTPITIGGASGTHLVNINQNPGAYMRIRYNATSGTGTLTATLSSRALGGA